MFSKVSWSIAIFAGALSFLTCTFIDYLAGKSIALGGNIVAGALSFWIYVGLDLLIHGD